MSAYFLEERRIYTRSVLRKVTSVLRQITSHKHTYGYFLGYKLIYG